jgi:hypothetical protein
MVGVQSALCANAEYKWRIYRCDIFGIFLFGSCRCIKLYAGIASANFIAYVGRIFAVGLGRRRQADGQVEACRCTAGITHRKLSIYIYLHIEQTDGSPVSLHLEH